MTIEIKFKKIDDSEGEYYVSLDGHAGELIGTGDDGRVKASGKVAHNKMSKEAQKKWLETFKEAEAKCEKIFSLSISRSLLTFTVDGKESYKKPSIDELAVVISQIEAPTKGHRPPGF
ncbi:hypothetical protein GOZ90_11470 [Agrobacterium vitis]|uniref:Uncharacterized protein n=1 Tax=Agrobacterium vitis TaxID=373 RepID=A0A6L6VED9_AGRVI|nr:hypothetical protein [Agrobacterium vitis]MUZ73301.1 hypothetical protein [Agrobacterium vitis]